MRNREEWEPYLEQNGPSEAWGICVKPTKADREAQKRKVIIQATTKLDSADVARIADTHNANLGEKEGTVWCKSLVNSRLEPRVSISIGGHVVQLSYPQARNVIQNLTEANEAAISDALLMRFLRAVVFAGEDSALTGVMAAQMLQQFREFRDDMTNLPVDEASKEV